MATRIVAVNGTDWSVWEVYPNAASLEVGALSDEFREGWLCMQSAGGEKRRIAPIPPGWMDWSDGRLGLAIRLAAEGAVRVEPPPAAQ